MAERSFFRKFVAPERSAKDPANPYARIEAELEIARVRLWAQEVLQEAQERRRSR